MIAILIDTANLKINECFGVSSYLQLQFFEGTYGEEFFKNIRCLNPEKIYVLSDLKNNQHNLENVEYIKDLNDISYIFREKEDEFTCLFFSDVFFECDEGFMDLINNPECKEYSVVNENGDVVSQVFSNKKICEILSRTDFKKSLFIEETSIKISFNSYSKSVVYPDDYRGLICDIISGKTSVNLPEVAENIFAINKIPQGDFVIIPPVFFGEKVQVESGCVIGPNTAIMSDCLVSRNSNVRNSFLCSNSFVSSSCFLDGVLCCENVSVRRNSIILPHSVIGRDCVLGEESIIENDSYLRPFTRVDSFENKIISNKSDSYQSPGGFYGYTPEKSALLGAAIGIVFGSPSIAVACDGELNSTALKLSLLGGLMTTGASCYDFGNTFLSSMHYYMSFCELDCAVFISGNKNGTVITVFKKGNYKLSNSDYYNIKNILMSHDIKRCASDECKSIRQIQGLQRMYIRNLMSKIDTSLDFFPSFQCENRRIQSILDITTSKIPFKNGKKRILFNVNAEGTNVTAQSNSLHYSNAKLTDIVSHFLTEKGDLFLKDISGDTRSLWRLDGVILCFELIGILARNNLTLEEAAKMLPTFYVAENTVSSKISVNKLVSRISEKNNVVVKNGLLEFYDGNSRVQINRLNDNTFKIAAKAVTVEAAREIVGGLTEIISGYLT